MKETKHSKAYHRYFEDYAELQTLDENGRSTTQRVYVGKYYRVKLADSALRRQKLLFALFYLISAAAYLWAAATVRISAAGPVAIFTAACLIALLWLAMPVFHRLTSPREMEVRAWRESADSLRRVSLGAAVCLFVCAGATLSAALVLPAYDWRETLPGVFLYLLSGGMSLGIALLEKGTEYEVLPPKNQRPEGASPIRRYAPD